MLSSERFHLFETATFSQLNLHKNSLNSVTSPNQVQAENYTQNNGQPPSTHGPGIGGNQNGTQDVRHGANVTPIPAPVMGKHSSYNYRARNDGDPVVKVVS